MTPGQIIAAFRAYRIVWIGCCVFLALNLLYYLIGVRGQAREARSLRKSYLAKRGEPVRPSVPDDNLKRYIDAKQTLQTFRKALPQDAELENIENNIDQMLEENQLTAGAPVRFAYDKVSQLLLWRYTAEVSVIGPYGKLRQFLADLQNSARLLCIEELTLSNRSGETDQAEMKLRISTYLRGSMRMLPLE